MLRFFEVERKHASPTGGTIWDGTHYFMLKTIALEDTSTLYEIKNGNFNKLCTLENDDLELIISHLYPHVSSIVETTSNIIKITKN